jgi:hypothetical protein
MSYAAMKLANPEKLTAMLTELGLNEASVAVGINGRLEVQGVIPTEYQRVALLGKLAQMGSPPRVNAVVGEHLARSAEDIFRQRGLNARAKYVGAGVLELSEVLPSERVNESVSQVLATIQGVKDIAFVETTAEPAGSQSKTSDVKLAVPVLEGDNSKSNGKRITGVIGGTEPFIVTADGGRYGPGSILSDGSVIEHIEDDVVKFRRGQETVAIKF